MTHKKTLAGLALCVAGLAACDADTGADMSSIAAAPSIQEQACLAGVSNETNNGDVAVLSNEFSEANSLVMIGVGPDRAPWRCLVSNDGIVAEISSATDEGAL
jgi:hypothetical protein